MKYIVAFLAIFFSLSSFAYLKDFPIAQMERDQKWMATEQTEYPLDAYLFSAARSVRINGLGAYKAQMIANKDEYLFWKNYYLEQITEIIDKSTMMLDKDVSAEERSFLIRVVLLAKFYQSAILKNRINLAKYTQDVWEIMADIWPGQIIAVNIPKLNAMNSIEDRYGMIALLHEITHDYYLSGVTAPTSGPDVATNEVIYSCAYQESLAWDVEIRFVKLLERFDMAFDIKAIGMEWAYRAVGDSNEWAKFVARFCTHP